MGRALPCLLVVLGACAAEPETAAFVAEFPFSAQIDPCLTRADLGTNMEAILEIGGHEPCPLDVDPLTLVARGECNRITIGIVRPLGLGFWYPNPGAGPAAALAYVISWVDLSKESLDENATSVNVQMDTTPTTGNATQVETDDELAALPGDDDCATLSGNELRLCAAEAWAKGQLMESNVIFDLDEDGPSNLQEACDGTLWL